MTKTRKKSESRVAQDVRLEVSQELGCVLFRNNVGAFQAASGSWVRYGLANESKAMNQHIKSSDLIGFTPVVVTAEMVGKTIPVFTAIETKEEGYVPRGKAQQSHYEAQDRFCDRVRAHGGIAGIVDSGAAAVELVRKWLQSFN